MAMGIVGELLIIQKAEIITGKNYCELVSKLSEHGLSAIYTDRGVCVDEKQFAFLCYEFLTGSKIAEFASKNDWLERLIDKHSFNSYYQEWHKSANSNEDRFWLVNFRDYLDDKPWAIFTNLSQQTGICSDALRKAYHCFKKVPSKDMALIAKALQIDVSKLGPVKELSLQQKQELRKWYGLWYLLELKNLMQEVQVSSEELVKRVFLQKQTIYDIAALRNATTLHTMRKIAKALGVSLEQLKPVRRIRVFQKGQGQLNLK